MPKRVPETGVRVLAVDPKGLAARAGLKPGDRLLRVNGQGLRDLVDFHVQAGEEQLAIDVDRGGRPCSVVLERKWGRTSASSASRRRRRRSRPAPTSACSASSTSCRQGLRKSLYVKDDDYRLSFLHGNYITLTDLPDSEVERIVDLRLSPLYISVHATDPVLRHFLLGSPKTIKGDLMERLRRLADAGIRLHTQIVLCPGLNDGPHLERTVRELGELHPGVATVAVVPVGLTRHRDGLYPLRSITPAEAAATLDAIHGVAGALPRAATARGSSSRPTSCTSRRGRPIPPAAAYEDFSVVEDGVGLVRRFEDDLRSPAGPARAPALARPARGDPGDRRAVRPDPRPAARRDPRARAPGRGRPGPERVLRPRDHRGGAPHRRGHRARPLRPPAGRRGPDPSRGADRVEGRVPRRRGARRPRAAPRARRSLLWNRARAASSTACSAGRPTSA